MQARCFVVILREELEEGAVQLGFARVKNIGDVPYSFRYRNALPDSILETQTDGREWIIEGAGKGRYRFRLLRNTRVVPRDDLVIVDIPDSTPELIRTHAFDDEPPTETRTPRSLPNESCRNPRSRQD